MDDVKMDEPTTNFLSLSDIFKLQILKELDWKSLMNLKLVCRNFYFLIEKNIEHMDRPKVRELKVVCRHGEVRFLDYIIKKHSYLFIEPQDVICFFKSKKQYDRFLKERDFTEIEKLELFKEWTYCPANEGYKYIRNEYIEIMEVNADEIECDEYYFKISEDGYDEDSIAFDQYSLEKRFITIETVSDASWKKLCYDLCIKSDSLRDHGFFEKNGSALIAVKLVMCRLTGNPNFNYINVSTNDERPLHMDILECLFKCNYFNFEGRCNRKQIYFIFELDAFFNEFERNFYYEIFNKVKFANNLEEFEETFNFENGEHLGDFSIETLMNCQKCGTEHLNKIYFSESDSTLEIILK
uniref:F-box domain-containing protein n=1 Tax=Strongyloides venezuelensis TaxID=75913 RepID=A0A0K0EVS4_STRVS